MSKRGFESWWLKNIEPHWDHQWEQRGRWAWCVDDDVKLTSIQATVEVLRGIGVRHGARLGEDRILWNPGREEVDEIVVHGATVHLEQVDDRCWWMGIYSADERRRLMVNFRVVSGKRKAMTVTCEDDGEVPWRWGKDEEHTY